MKPEDEERIATQVQVIETFPDLRRWRIEVPNLIDDSLLDPYQFRLLIHYYRRGSCYESVRTTAKVCVMSVGQVVASRNALELAGWITLHRSDGGITIRPIDRWEENLEHFASRKKTVHQVNTPVHSMNDSVHQVNQRINPLRNNPVKEVGVEDAETTQTASELFDPNTKEGQRRRSTLAAISNGFAETNAIADQVRLYLHMDPNWNTKTNRIILAFLKGIPPGQSVQAFAEWWFNNDWRGKQGQPPSTVQIKELWLTAFPPTTYQAAPTFAVDEFSQWQKERK